MGDPSVTAAFPQGLPPEFEAQLAALMRQRQLGQTMLQQGLQQTPTQFTPGPYSHAVPQGMGQGLVKALSAYLGGQQSNKAEQGMFDIQGQAANQEAGELSALTHASDRNRALAQALASRNPRVRAFAAAQQKFWQDQAGKTAEVLKESDVPAAVRAAQGQLPGMDYQQPSLGDVEIKSEGADKYAIIPGRGGKREFKWAPRPPQLSVDARQQTQELGAGLSTIEADLKERKVRAEGAKGVLSSNTMALEALNRGAQAGGLGGFKQVVRKTLQGFGINLPETAETEELSMALGNALLENAKKLYPVSNVDMASLREMLGSVNTDPTALMKMLTTFNGIAAKELQDYNRWVEAQSNTLTNPRAQDMVRNANIGFETQAPPGSQVQQLRSIQELTKRGGDPSQFQIGGKPIEPGAQFDIRGAGIPSQTPGASSGGGPLTPEEQRRYDELRRKYGRP